LYHDAGDLDRAAQAYRRDIEGGDPLGHQNLGVLLEEEGDLEGALEHYRIGASLGDTMAARSYDRLRFSEEPPE